MNKTVTLVGNPNVGKSVIFGKLTGQYAVVSNYPGTTVDITEGNMVLSGEKFLVIDTPGTNSLLPLSEDEKVTRDLIFARKPDLIVQVADSKNLRRALLLTFELIELKIPLILVLNMYDEATTKGMKIDSKRLEKIIGAPVVKTIGITGEGVNELKKLITAPHLHSEPIKYSGDIENVISEIEKELPLCRFFNRSLALMLISGEKSAWHYVPGSIRKKLNEKITAMLSEFLNNPQFLLFDRRDEKSNEITAEVVNVSDAAGFSWLGSIGQLAMRPFPGYIFVLLVLFAAYEFVGVFAAGVVVDFLEHTLFGKYLIPAFTALIQNIFHTPLITEFLVGKYGIVSVAITYALAIVFPIVGAFFILFGFLEDSGYLPRLSVMLDRIFRSFGLNGKAVLPMVLGLGCGTMAVMGSRILETKKERLIVMLLLSLAIPCSAQLGVILGLLSGLSWMAAFIWIISITVSLTAVGLLSSKLIPGSQSTFILEIPPLRKPEFSNILMKVKMRIVWYLKEAVPLFVVGTFILFVADKLNLIILAERFARPVISGLLGLPAQATESFILGFLRRDYGAAGLFMLAKNGLMNPRQVVVSIVAITLFVPCIAQFFMVVKEQGLKIASVMLVFVSIYALLFAGMVNFIIKTFHIL